MRALVAALVLAFPVACAAQSGQTAVGARDASGVPIGEYRIIDKAGRTEVQGRFQHGKMHGKWLFFDSRQVKVAEVTYQNGVASGPFRTYFGSIAHPSAAGKLESEGQLQNGRITGKHIAYGPAGDVFSNAIFDAGKVRTVITGPSEAAARTAALDIQFIRFLEANVHSTVK